MVFSLLAAAALPAAAQESSQSASGLGDPDVMVRVVDAPFDEVVVRLVSAITSANFRVTGENDIGDGLRQRGHADFPRYVIVHFCSLELAREGVLIDRRLGAIMPCRAAVYEENGRVVIALTSARAILAPLHNPALAGLEAKLQAAFTRILNDTAN